MAFGPPRGREGVNVWGMGRDGELTLYLADPIESIQHHEDEDGKKAETV